MVIQEFYQRSFGVKFGDLYDVAFVQDKYLDGVIVVNRSHNRLLAYQRPNGKFYPMFYATYQSIHTEVSTVNFSSASATSDGRLIVTSEALDESCVLVVDIQSGHAQQKRNLVFGKGHLACPRKALYYENEFFVCDRDNESIKVFDARGAYRREIGEDLECPRGIAIDNNSGNILIADPGTDSIHAYKSRDGSFVGKIASRSFAVISWVISQLPTMYNFHQLDITLSTLVGEIEFAHVQKVFHVVKIALSFRLAFCLSVGVIPRGGSSPSIRRIIHVAYTKLLLKNQR